MKMKHLLASVAAVAIYATQANSQTYSSVQWGMNRAETPSTVCIMSGSTCLSTIGSANISTGLFSMWVNYLAVKPAPYSQKSITVSSAPSYSYPYLNPTTFNGDFSNTVLPLSYTVDGAATLGQPTTGYQWSPAVTPYQTLATINSGWNQSTSGNGGRTGYANYRSNVVHNGQGDAGAYYGGCWAYGAKAGATHWLASPACILLNGGLNAGNNHQYLQGLGDINFIDNGFDTAVAADARLYFRTNDTASLGEVWLGYINSSRGSKAIDVAYANNGKIKVGYDTVLATGLLAAINVGAGQKIVLNSTSTPINGINWYGNNIGGDSLYYDSGQGQISLDDNSHRVLGLKATGDAVEYIRLFSQAAGNGATISGQSDTSTDVSINLVPKGNGYVNVSSGVLNVVGKVLTQNSFQIKGSSTGLNILDSTNASGTDYTSHMPNSNGTLAQLETDQTWTGIQFYQNLIRLSQHNSLTYPIPACSPSLTGAVGAVLDALAPVNYRANYTPTGTGAGQWTIVFCDGVNWTYH